MKIAAATIIFLPLLLCAGCGDGSGSDRPSPAAWPADKIVDLTHDFDENTIYWPTEAGFVLEKGPAGETEKGYYYAANRMRLAEHGGTHIDAPIHFYRARFTVEEVPLTTLMGRGVVVDVSKQAERNRDHLISIADFEAWEKEHGRIDDGAIVLLRTGFSRFWPDRVKYLGTARRGAEAVKELHFPGLDHRAADWLVEQRKVKLVGIDTASIDHGQSGYFRAHVRLFKHNVPALENLAHLDRLPARGFTLIALPMKIKSGTGGPARVIALLD